MMKSRSKIFFLVLISVVFLLLIFLAFFSQRLGDDYKFPLLIQEHNVFNYCWDMYMNWDGRAIAPLGVLIYLFIGYMPHEMVVIIWLLLFVLSNMIIVQLVTKATLNKINVVIGSILVTGFLIIGMQDHIASSLFSAVTGLYIPIFFFCILWYYLFRKGWHKTKFRTFLFFTILISTLSQMYIAAITVLFLIEIVSRKGKIELRNILKKRNFIILLVLFLGQLVINISPGTLKRYGISKDGYYAESVSNEVTIKELLFHDLHLNYICLSESLLIIIFGVVAGIVIGSIQRVENNTSNSEKLPFLKRYKYLLAAMASMLIFYPILLFENRYLLSFQIFFFVFFMEISYSFIKRRDIFNTMKVQWLLGISLVLISSILGYQLKFRYAMYNFIEKRELLLERNRGSDEYLVEYFEEENPPFMIKSYGINKFSFIKSQTEIFFDIDTITPIERIPIHKIISKEYKK